ncbi:MAG: zinc-dependent alcohol dehydrogenase [Candidatus Hodarchaeales archaeon]
MSMMKAAVYDGQELGLTEVPIPEPANNQTLIQLYSVGVCGTDHAIISGNLDTPTPIIPGHELVGKVVSIGVDVDESWLGKRVTSEINTLTCGKCYFCKNGFKTQCFHRKALGIHRNGAFAEYIAIESNLLHEIPKNISYDQATFIEPLAAAYQTFETMPVDTNDRIVAIFGMGKLGLLLLQVTKEMGLEVIAVDGSEEKLRLARQVGAIQSINYRQNVGIAHEIRSVTDGIGVDIVIDATGNPDCLKSAIPSCRPKGKIHIKSTYKIIPIDFRDIVMNEKTIYSSRCGPFKKAINGLEKGSINTDIIKTRFCSLDDIETVFMSKTSANNFIRTIIKIK